MDNLRKVFEITLREFNNSSIQNQLDSNQKFYVLNEGNADFFKKDWIPIGVNSEIEKNKSTLLDNGGGFSERYSTFETQMYISMIKYLKNVCGIQNVGIAGCVLDVLLDDCLFPLFTKKNENVINLNIDMLYRMNTNCIYYFS